MTPFMTAFPPGTVIRPAIDRDTWSTVHCAPYKTNLGTITKCTLRGATVTITEAEWNAGAWHRLIPFGRWENVNGLVDDAVKGDWRDV